MIRATFTTDGWASASEGQNATVLRVAQLICSKNEASASMTHAPYSTGVVCFI
jgi:hypothetical protein